MSSAEASAARLLNAESKFLDAKSRLLALLRPDDASAGEHLSSSILDQLPQLPTRPGAIRDEGMGGDPFDSSHPYHAFSMGSVQVPSGLQETRGSGNTFRHLSSLHQPLAPTQPPRVARGDHGPGVHTYSVEALEGRADFMGSLQPSSGGVLGGGGSPAGKAGSGRKSRLLQPRETTMAPIDGTRFVETGGPTPAARSRRVRKQAAPVRKSGLRDFDLSLGPAHTVHNTKLREESLALTDERILYQRQVRTALARQSRAAARSGRRRPSRAATAGRQVLASSIRGVPEFPRRSRTSPTQ